MTCLVSIRLNDQLFHQLVLHAQALHLSRTEYIKKAIERMNDEAEKMARELRLKQSSLRVRADSMRVNAEFDEVDHDPEA